MHRNGTKFAHFWLILADFTIMTIEFRCTSCSKLLQVSEEFAGRNCQCPSCGVMAVVPHPAPRAPLQQAPAQSPAQTKIACPHCSGTMAVPASAAGKQVNCPFCKKPIVVPSQSAAPSQQAPTQPTGDIFSSFDQELSGFGNPAGGASQNPYAVSQQSYSAPQRRNSNSPVQYIIVGVIFIVFGVLWILGSCVATLRRSLEEPNFMATPEGQGYIFGMLTLIIFSLGAIIGGISFVSAGSKRNARAASILACIPCLCLGLAIPFGIWGCVLTFSESANRYFRKP